MTPRPFVLFGVSVDRDEEKLRDYLAREREGWPQFWDHSGQMTSSFHVHSFPTFVVLDGEGRIVYANSGWGGASERQLLLAVNRALDRLASDQARAGTRAPK